MLETIKELSMLDGVSGRENAVREYIINAVSPYADSIETDPLGNLIVFKKGKNAPKNKVMLDAHMDEVGFMITHINSDGTLDFERVGGIDKRVMLGRPVTVGENKVNGVIGVKATHMVPAAEKLNMPSTMYIDIGAENAEDAEKVVSLGDYACFNSDFVEFGDGWTDTTIHEWRHHHTPTVEDVLREFADGIKDQNADFAELAIAEYAKRLKLVEREDA